MPAERKHSISPMTRRTALKTFAAVAAASVWSGRASAAPEFSFKVATSHPAAHPINVRLTEAAERVREATSGRMELRLFPAGQLGSDPDLIVSCPRFLWTPYCPEKLEDDSMEGD